MKDVMGEAPDLVRSSMEMRAGDAGGTAAGGGNGCWARIRSERGGDAARRRDDRQRLAGSLCRDLAHRHRTWRHRPCRRRRGRSRARRRIDANDWNVAVERLERPIRPRHRRCDALRRGGEGSADGVVQEHPRAAAALCGEVSKDFDPCRPESARRPLRCSRPRHSRSSPRRPVPSRAPPPWWRFATRDGWSTTNRWSKWTSS